MNVQIPSNREIGSISQPAFIVWADYNRRSELLAQHLGAKIHYVKFGRRDLFWQAPFRYVVQSWLTWLLLQREQPDLVFVQNPPIFAALVVAIYARYSGANYVIDSHTGAFRSAKWRWSVGLHRWVSVGALTTIVHNVSQESLIKSWGCSYSVVGFTAGEYPHGDPYPLSGEFNVAVICSFEADEPLDVVFEAARLLTAVQFYITGDARQIEQRLLKAVPDNICLTGYLSYERYIGLLRGVDVILDLVDDEATLLMGGFEAVSLGVPLILSDWPLLRDYFSKGTIYVANTPIAVSEGVLRAQRERGILQREILQLREELEEEWSRKADELQHLLSQFIPAA